MKKQKVQSSINLETLAGGAFAEKINEALGQVAENIQDQNTEATANRGITVNIKFKPSKNRQMVSTSISVQTKLAAAEAIDTQIVMGVNMKTGQIEIAEYDQAFNQMPLTELEPVEEPAAPETAAQEQTHSINKVLDLRNRGKKPKPGIDFNPVTGELYENTKEA